MSAFKMLVAFMLLIGLAGAALLIQEGMAAQSRLAARLALVSRRSLAAAPVSAIRREADRPSPFTRIATLLGCDWQRRDAYPVRWWIVLVGTCVAGRVVALLASSVLGEASLAVWPIATLALSRMLFRGWAHARRDKLLSQFPDALGMIVRTVRVGVPVVEGAKLVAAEAPEPTRAEFRNLADQIAIGARLDEAVLAMADRIGMAEYRFFATTIVLQAQTGGGLGEALDGLADVVRRRVALRARGFALSSEARTSAKVLTGLPFVAGLSMLLVAPGYMDPLIYTVLGHKMMTVAAMSLVVGALVMRSMIRRVLT
ncbi:MAG: type II secretion system F family protein [Acetobacteraceae bacterium]|nr:type II secretion system F family protein [Acetobacteraceae bacterium]